MHRKPFLDLLDAYHPEDSDEIIFKEEFLSFVETYENCFDRSLSIGHITGSAWIVNYSCSKVLLTHHKKLDRWLQLGGHADGDANIIRVATKEAQEESGLTSLSLVSTDIFDLDIHKIPARSAEPEHLHYDIRFLFEANDSESLHVSSESKNLEWVSLDALSSYTQHNTSITRMAKKCKKR